MFLGSAVCPGAVSPGCRCVGTPCTINCRCVCHTSKPGQLILPFDWDAPGLGPEPKTPTMAPACPDCGREWAAALDEYHGTDPDLAARCVQCRSKLERWRKHK